MVKERRVSEEFGDLIPKVKDWESTGEKMVPMVTTVVILGYL